MNNTLTKRIAVILAAVLLLTAAPFYGFADDEVITDPADQKTEIVYGWKTVNGARYWANGSGKIANSATAFTVEGKRKDTPHALMDRDKAGGKSICI